MTGNLSKSFSRLYLPPHCRYSHVDRIHPSGYIISVEQTKTALIVIDGSDGVKKAAESLSAALKGCNAKICNAETFQGTDLLPAHVFFIGCDKPAPPSFTYLDEMLQHINLSGRSCGVFSTDNKALNYLTKLVLACGASQAEPLLIKDISAISTEIRNWVKTIPASNF